MDYDYGDELPVIQGGISAMQWDMTRDEREELEEQLKRKRPCGFTAWPEPEEEQIEKLDDGAGVPGTPGKANTRKPRSRSRK